MCDGVFTTNYQAELDQLPDSTTIHLESGMSKNAKYVWHSPSLSRLSDFSNGSSDHFFSRVVEVKSSSTDYERYARKPVLAKFTGVDGAAAGESFVYSLPAVCVTARGGKEMYYSISGKEGVIYTYADGAFEPPCFFMWSRFLNSENF